MKIKNCLSIFCILVFVSMVYADTNETQVLPKKDTQVKKVVRRVNTEQEALKIAEDFLKQKGLAGDFYLFKYITKLKDGVWHVVFLKKEEQEAFGKVKSMRVKIDKKTGEVIGHEEQEGYFIDKGFR